MPFIHGVAEDSATGLLAELFAADRNSRGYLPSLATTFGIRPEVYQGWRQLNGAIKTNMDARRYELATLAAAAALGSSYCSLAHGRVLVQEYMSEEEVIGLVSDPDSSVIAPVGRPWSRSPGRSWEGPRTSAMGTSPGHATAGSTMRRSST